MKIKTSIFVSSLFIAASCCFLAGCNSDTKDKKNEKETSEEIKNEIKTDDKINDFYAILSGEAKDTTLTKLTDSSEINSVDFWENMNNKLLTPIKQWKTGQLPDYVQKTEFLFYPFSGPDFLIPNTIFENTKHIVMFGLEHPGKDVSGRGNDFAKRAKPMMQKSLRDYCNKSYFITKNMITDFNNDTLPGVTPLIATFLTKEKFKLISIKNFKLIKGGTKEYYSADSSPLIKDTSVVIGVEINYTKNNKDSLKIDYLSFNAEDYSIKYHTEVTDFFEKTIPAQTVSYLKSASYLLHYDIFSVVRNIVLKKSRAILQDDTGVSVRYFDSKDWKIKLWGVYEKPIRDFSGVYQKDLDSMYKSAAGSVQTLPFNMGYHFFNGNQNLFLAERITK